MQNLINSFQNQSTVFKDEYFKEKIQSEERYLNEVEHP